MGQRGRITSQYTGSLTQVLSSRSVNEIKGGATFYERRDSSAVHTWKGDRISPYHPVLEGGPVVVTLRGFTIGANPLNIVQNTANIRDDFTTSYEWRGRHDVKMGGEYMWFLNDFRWCLRCTGTIDATGGNPPANIEALFPVWNDSSTWNLQPLLPITRFVQHSLTNTEHTYDVTRNLLSGWVQDDWRMNDRLTLNLGVRYDWDSNGNNERLEFRPWLPGDLARANANFAPRIGVNYLHRRADLAARRLRALLRVPAERRRAAVEGLSLLDRGELLREIREPDRPGRTRGLPAELVRAGRERGRRVGRAEADRPGRGGAGLRRESTRRRAASTDR